MRKLGILFCALLSCFNTLQAKDIILWHAFDGPLETAFVEIVEDFNHHSGTYKVIPIKKGNYKEVYEKGLESHKAGNGPQILHVYEVATLTCMMTPGVFRPVQDLMQAYNKKFDSDVYIDVVKAYYSAPNGKMMSFPWNVSTGILFYNKNLFANAGLDPEKPPATWTELEEISKKFVATNCVGFTTTWPAAYHLEHLSCWHNLSYATYENGFSGLETRFNFNSPERIFHVAKVSEWQKSGIFSYKGRYNEEGEKFFTDEKCAILLQGANRMPLLKQKAKFEIGVGYMPYWPQMVEKPYNLNIGGASFWAMEGFSDDDYRGISQFFEYLSSTAIQAHWHQKTGYLPVTDAAYYLTKKKGFYKDHQASEIAVLSVMEKKPTINSRGMRFGDYVRIRDIIVDHLEKAFLGEMSAKEALDAAVDRGNQLLEDFEKANISKK